MLNKHIKKEFDNLLPYFLDTSENSNISKHHQILSNRHSELLQQIKNLQLYSIIERPIQIQKVQTEPNHSELVFRTNIKNIVEVILKNDDKDEIIYQKKYTDPINSFKYSIDDMSIETIPKTKYSLRVVTDEGYVFEKGYPHDDSKYSKYSRDEALDFLGRLFNIPRHHHKQVQNIEEYYNTLPTFFDESVEDDYYYQKRIENYLEKYGVTQLPVLELEKHYGITPKMQNRKLLIHQQNIHDMQESSEPPHEIYMRTKENYNSCVYDFYCDYDAFPTNLKKPTAQELENIFQNSLPITKKAIFNISLNNILPPQNLKYKTDYNVSIGLTKIYSTESFENLSIIGDLVLTSSGDLIYQQTQNHKLIALDSIGNLFLLDADDEETGIVIVEENGDIKIEA